MTEYAKLAAVAAGDILVTDGGFTCMRAGERKEVLRDAHGALFIECNEGYHGLNGQVNDAGLLIGLAKMRA